MISLAERLRTADLRIVGRFAAASNVTLLCRFADAPPLTGPPDLERLDPAELAVYKPQSGEAPLWDFPEGTLHRREVATYELDCLLGWDLVPVTVLRDDGPLGTGAVQEYVDHDPERHYFWMIEEGPERLVDQLRRMVLFDLIVDNADRKGGHVLLRPDGRIRLIDHGVTFSVETKHRTVAWHFAGEPVPPALRADVERLAARLEAGELAALPALLAPEEVARTIDRASRVARLEAFPEPRGPRPYPWPLL